MRQELINHAIKNGAVEWSAHALKSMLERGISRSAVLDVIAEGTIIENYPHDRPFPSMLLLGYYGKRPLHIVYAFDEKNGIVFIITAYEPDLKHFESDWKTRRTI